EMEVFAPHGQYRMVDAGEAVEFDGTLISVHPVAMPTVTFRLSSTDVTILTFMGVPLSEAVRVFNWYNRRKLVMDADLKEVSIGGQFFASNPEGFADALAITSEITHSVSRDPETGNETIRLRRRRAPNDPLRTTRQPHVTRE